MSKDEDKVHKTLFPKSLSLLILFIQSLHITHLFIHSNIRVPTICIYCSKYWEENKIPALMELTL